MKIAEYVELRKAELCSFEKLWAEKMAEDPDNWPEEFEVFDWYEQELAFIQPGSGDV